MAKIRAKAEGVSKMTKQDINWTKNQIKKLEEQKEHVPDSRKQAIDNQIQGFKDNINPKYNYEYDPNK